MNKNKLRKLYPLLNVLSKLNDTDRQIIITYLNNEGCAGICTCIENALTNKTLSIQKREKLLNELSNDKRKFRSLLKEEGVENGKKFKTLKKVGGKVGVVLETVLPLLEKYIEK